MLRAALSMMLFLAVLACSRPMPESRSASPAAASAAPAAAAAVAPAPQPLGVVAKAGPSVFKVSSILEPDRPLNPGDYVWNADGAPAGPLQIVIDIEAQRLYVYRGGVEIGRSSLIYGADDKPTPHGPFTILEKDADHVSNLYGADMPYMLRLTWDGIAIHGSEVDEWSATHGCIGVPDDFAALLFAEAKLGDNVLVTKAWLPEVHEA